MTTLEFIEKINGKEIFSEDEIKEILFEGFEDKERYEFIRTDEGAENRWTRDMRDIFYINDEKFYAVPWERGLTEFQENLYDDQPYEVQEVTKTVVITTYEPII